MILDNSCTGKLT